MVFVLPELGSAFQPYVINRSDALAAAFVCPAALLLNQHFRYSFSF